MNNSRRNTVKIIDKTDWPQLCEPVWLCLLPVKAADLSKVLTLDFEAEEETGIGSVWYSYISIKGKPVAFKTYSIDSTEEQYVSVYIAGQETGWQQLLKDLCFLFSIQRSELLHEETLLVEGQWQLLSIDMNGDEKEIMSFPDDFRAEQALAFYENKNSAQKFRVVKSKTSANANC